MIHQNFKQETIIVSNLAQSWSILNIVNTKKFNSTGMQCVAELLEFNFIVKNRPQKTPQVVIIGQETVVKTTSKTLVN